MEYCRRGLRRLAGGQPQGEAVARDGDLPGTGLRDLDAGAGREGDRGLGRHGDGDRGGRWCTRDSILLARARL